MIKSKVIETRLGGTLQLFEAPEHLQPGVLLIVGVTDDPMRKSEILIDPSAWLEFSEAMRGMGVTDG